MLSRNKAVCVASPSYMGGGGGSPKLKSGALEVERQILQSLKCEMAA